MTISASGSDGCFRCENVTRLSVVLLTMLLIASTLTMVGTANPSSKDSGTAEEQDYIEGVLLVRFKETASDDAMKEACKAVTCTHSKTFKASGVQEWRLGDEMSVEDALKELGKKKYADVLEFAEPDWLCSVDGYPTDSLRGDLWNFHNLGQTGGTYDADIDMLEVWDEGPEASEVVVAVLDTGIDYTHPDLDGVMWTNPGETEDNGVDDDGNGFVDDYYGWDFYNDDCDPMDDNGHGSHCAGVIAAEHDGSGVAGMAQGMVKVMAVKWLNAGGSGYVSDAIEAIDYAASHGVKITSNSWGVTVRKKESDALKAAISGSGALFVASAGNSGSSKEQLPAGYDLDNIVSVAATDDDDGLASFSNYGTSWVDLAAPGVSVLSCYKGGGYVTMSGTSMSAPHVAGAAALVMSADVTKSVAQTKAVILANVEDETSLDGKVGTGGKLNARQIFGLAEVGDDGSSPEQIADLASMGCTMSTVDLEWTAVGEDQDGTGACYLYEVRYLTGTITTFDWQSATPVDGEPVPQAPGVAEAYTVTGLTAGTTYNFAIKAVDAGGRAAAASDHVTMTTEAPKWLVDGTVDTTVADVVYCSMAIDADGNPAFAYAYSGTTYFTCKDGNGDWQVETVTSGGGGVDLAHDGSDWWVVTGGSTLMVAQRTGADTWSTTTIESGSVGVDWKTIECYGEIVGVAYELTGKKGGLKYAEYDGSSWTKEMVDSKAGARYCDIEFDSDGEPGIAYSDSSDGEWLDMLMYAHRSGSAWTIQTLLSGTVGYGVQVDLEYDSSDAPHMVCGGDGIFLISWDGSSWQTDTVNDYQYSNSPSLAIVDGTFYVSFEGGEGVAVSKLASGEWTPELVCAETGSFRTCLEYDAGAERLHLGFAPWDVPYYATRDLSDAGPVWG